MEKPRRTKTQNQIFIIKIVAAVAVLSLITAILLSEDAQRGFKSMKSNFAGGLPRIVNVYDYEGDLIASYKGRIDIQENNQKVLFDLDGKRYVYYNCPVEVIEISNEDLQE